MNERNNFDVIRNMILNLKVELEHLRYQTTYGGGDLSCCYFVSAAYPRSVSDS